jgi:hypothetical protein
MSRSQIAVMQAIMDLLNTLTTHGQKLPDATEVNMQRALLDHAAYLTKR